MCYNTFKARIGEKEEGLPIVEGYGSILNVTKDDLIDELGNGYCYEPDKYNGVVNNCCTVAFESLRQVTEESLGFDLSPNLRRINKRNYNVCGLLSISFRSFDDSFWATLKGYFRLSAEVIFSTYKYKIRREDNVERLEKYCKELKEEEEFAVRETLQRYQ